MAELLQVKNLKTQFEKTEAGLQDAHVGLATRNDGLRLLQPFQMGPDRFLPGEVEEILLENLSVTAEMPLDVIRYAPLDYPRQRVATVEHEQLIVDRVQASLGGTRISRSKNSRSDKSPYSCWDNTGPLNASAPTALFSRTERISRSSLVSSKFLIV